MAFAMTVVGWLLLVAACVLAIPSIVLLVEVSAAASMYVRRAPKPRVDDIGSIAVLMPAHNEAPGIAAALATVLPQLRALDRLLVVADNCSDATAAVARGAGAEVVERNDPLRRGKGYALDFGVRHFERSPPNVVVIVDADCALDADALDRLASRCTRSGRPTQALYVMRCPPGAGLRGRIAEFAWIVRNHVRPLGALRLGWPCQLMGTGMAIPWRLIERASLASGHLVEDLELGLDLAAAGCAPVFCPDARVTSFFPSDPAAAAAQRTRWEHGHLSMIVSKAPRLLWIALTQRRAAILAMALDLSVPPLASLVMVVCAVAFAAAAAAMAGASATPLFVALAALASIVAAVLLSWARFGRPVVSLGELLGSPAYAFAKLPMYARLLKGRQAEWIRTRRDHKQD